MVHPVLLADKVLPVPLVLQVQLARLVNKVDQAHKDLPVQSVRRAPLVQVANPDPLDVTD